MNHTGPSDALIQSVLRQHLSKTYWPRMGVQGGEVLLLAADGVAVTLGNVWCVSDIRHLATYLDAHPTPETW